jgi:hypothetical protein
MAQPFDAARGEFTGQARELSAPLAVRIHTGRLLTDFSANARGMLVYPPRTNSLAELRWRHRGGKLLGSSRRILHTMNFARRPARRVFAEGRQ